ncbi:hypothetical protein M0M57_13630 [Flavobacterium azooxidireducens]|uniref:Uncharacterized protein n=1 Tax=Flavobacterium azooxidireducens TaxID=1871076 RepID=A0ABY4KGX5_9FLAO|nr:hypothetical protein [Flavobacterium azooxidireducens]UPQ78655.1 hypothetical protein M0M57_13630 [Flavobacterium azooxidireducens]
MEDWVSYFYEEKYNFSESFKNELSKQLGKTLQSRLEYENLFQDYFFNLFLGMTEIEITEKDNFVFANAEIISPDSQSRNITICWKSDIFENRLEIHKSEVEGKIEFFFCSDLPIEELKKYIKTKKQKNKIIDKLKFEINLNRFPDLVVKFEEKEKLTLEEKIEISSIFKKNKDIHVSEFIENLILLDFQIDSQKFNEEEFKVAEKYINQSLNLIKKLKYSEKISQIVVE